MGSRIPAVAVAPRGELHIADGARSCDPIVLACGACARVLVLGDDETPPVKCVSCGASICPDCAVRLGQMVATMRAMREDDTRAFAEVRRILRAEPSGNVRLEGRAEAIKYSQHVHIAKATGNHAELLCDICGAASELRDGQDIPECSVCCAARCEDCQTMVECARAPGPEGLPSSSVEDYFTNPIARDMHDMPANERRAHDARCELAQRVRRKFGSWEAELQAYKAGRHPMQFWAVAEGRARRGGQP